MSERRELICRIGEVKLGRGGDCLRATLGSCVGIAMVWRAERRCALAHCLLADAPSSGALEISARYVSQAIPSMLYLLKIPKDRYSELEVVVVGGSQMMGLDSSQGTRAVGKANAESALRHLAGRGIRVDRSDLGGNVGRQISVDCETFAIEVRLIGSVAA